jgi:hypothetical protein
MYFLRTMMILSFSKSTSCFNRNGQLVCWNFRNYLSISKIVTYKTFIISHFFFRRVRLKHLQTSLEKLNNTHYSRIINRKLSGMSNNNYNPYYLNLIFFHTHLAIEFVTFEYPPDQNIVWEC